MLSLSFFRGSSLPVVLQSEAAECGLACLAMVAGSHGCRTDLASLRRRWSVSLKGMTLGHLMVMAQDLRLAPRALRLELEQLSQLRRPAILHWDLDHFVVLDRVSGSRVRIIDPAVGRRSLSLAEASRHFTGVALELSPAEGFERRRESTPLPLSAFVHHVTGLRSALCDILLLSVALQVFVLAAPFFSQLIVDEMVVTGDRSLLTVLGLAFLLLAAIQVCITGIRGWLVIALGTRLQLGWVTRLFHHLVRLPLSWFEKRHMGDIVSRFSSIREVENLVAITVVEAVVDGLMAVTTLAVMLFYDTRLAAAVMLAVLAYTLVRCAMFPSMRLESHEVLMLSARENSLFMETLRAILPLKAFCREAMREAAWQNRKIDSLNAEIRLRRLQLLQQIANTGIFALENVVVLWLGALAVLAGNLSVGMLVAFLAYKAQFSARAAALVDKFVEIGLVRVHLDRLADIALSEREAFSGTAPAPVRSIQGRVDVEDLWFRYADTEPFVIAGLNLHIRAGESVAIAAPSGFGKTTLIKLMMGLFLPTSGRILVDGNDLRHVSPRDYRRQIASVMQDDMLLSGSLADNITLFDPEPDHEWMAECARAAAIRDDILAMPMGWSTLVGDMGSTLSGGQRQRILLARAFYWKPRLLFLDEATSHVDAATESGIHQFLRAMQITRVIVAHRRESLSMADRVIALPEAFSAAAAP